MVKRFKKFDPQLVVVEQLDGSAIALTNEAKLSLYKKSQKSGIPTNVLETVYYRGYSIWNESFGQTPEQFAFDRVNSFIAGGFARDLDEDLITEDGKGYKNPTGGLTQKGRDHYNRTTGSHLKAPVTTPPSKLKAGSKSANRRKSFCARMGGVKGPMRKPNGEPTRKALALRKWNCEETQLNKEDVGAAMSAGTAVGLAGAAALNTPYGKSKKSVYDRAYDTYDHNRKVKAIGKGEKQSYIKNLSPKNEEVIAEKRGLWDNIWAKRKRIANGSGEHMRKPGSKGAPSAADLKNSQNEEYTGSDPKSKDPNNPLARMDGTYQGAKTYADKTPGQKLAHTPSSTLKVIKKVVKEEIKLDRDKLADFALRLKAKDTENQLKMAEKGEPHPATEIPADFLSRKEHAKKYTTNGTEKTVKPEDSLNGILKYQRALQVYSNQGGKFNVKKEEFNPQINNPINELSVPLGATGKRKNVSTPMVGIRMSNGKIEKHPPGKSGSSGGGGGSDE
jgi:hypothetical protein